MKLDLESKIILVTGGAKGIGAAIVRACGKEGAVPVILDRDEAAIKDLQAELASAGIRTEAILTDLMNLQSTSRAVEIFAEKHGCIDGLVNNAGINDGVGLEHGTPEEFLLSLRKNLAHYYAMTQTVLPWLKRSRGAIVNISSKVAVTGQGGTSGYAASKGAILGLTTEWAMELSSYGVRVNAILPAEVRTPLYENWIKKFPDPEGKLREIIARIPLGRRMTEPHEIADMAVFLLSSRSANINGQHLYVDGGYVHLDRALA
jgi:NAD(P)-dependent dehydrogenase (short-subunit alcohol dehydrogenase family)